MRAHATRTSGRIRRGVLAGAAGALAMVGLPLLAVAPAGAVPAVDGNPDLAAGCGLDVTLVLDDSASINATEATQAREAAQAFADALVGTPSQLKTVVFDTRARGVAADGSLTSNLGSVVFRDPAAYTAPTSGAGQGGTNWDDGLEVARRSTGGAGDLLVFITDGDPTYRNTTTPDGHANDGSHDISGDGSTIGVAANLTNAVTEATAIRNGGTHIFGIGVGLTQNGNSEQRLNDVTGDEELTLSANGSVPPFGEGDYTITPNFSQLQTVVSDFARQLCGHTVNVTKFLQKADGTTVQATASTPWEFTLTLDPAPGQWNNPPGVVGPTASLTTDANGGVSFVLDQATPPDDHLGDLVETPQAGWDYNGATCSVNDFSGSNPTVLFDNVGANEPGSVGDPSELLDLPVSKGEALNCSVYNRERRPATISVAKSTVPAGQPGDFDFTLSKGQATVDTLTGLSHGDTQAFDPVPEGTYAITESPAPGFTNTSAACDDLATGGIETVSAGALTVTEGQSWRCSFVNDAQNGTVRVVKQSIGADGTFAFTSNVPDLGAFSLTTTGGTASTQTITVPVGTYSVAETVPAGWDLTAASCTGGDDPSSFTVSGAEDVVCTFENTAPAPSIVVAKSAGAASVGEPGGPVGFTVSVTNTSVEPVTVTSVTDSIDGGPALDLTSVGGPITATTCDVLVGTEIAAGASAGCTFTATVSGNGGDTVPDEVTVVAVDSDQNQATDSDGASVDVTDEAPTVGLTKTPSVASISEPGGSVTYTLEVTNTGVEAVQVDALRDSIEGGPSFDVSVVAGLVTATTCAAVKGATIAAGASASCQYTVVHVVDASDVPDGFVDDVARVDVSDDDGETFATAAAKVAVLDVLPTITVTKTADPTSVAETAPGATTPVTYTVGITNTSPEPVTIDSILDAVDGGSPQAVTGTCDDLVGDSLAAGASTSCTFTLQVSGEAGTSTTDVVTVGASDDDDNSTSGSDDAAVAFTDVASSIEVTKVATTPSVPEPGGPASFLVTIQNTSATDDVTIGSIVDSVDGGPPFAVAGSCPDLVGDVLVPGQSTQCSFTLDVAGPAGASVPDTVTVTGTDDDGASVSDSGDAAVRITDVPSSLSVTKVANVASVPEPGGPVTYTVTVTNTSAVDTVAIASVTDSVDGGAPFAAGGDCPDLVGDLLAPGEDASCSFTLDVTGQPGDVVDDTVTVAGIDDDQQAVSDSADESVAITGVGSSLSVIKVANVDSVPEPGGPVTYTVGITNSSTVDAVTIDSVTDSVEGGAPFAAGGDCPGLVGDVLAAGASTSCSFTLPVTGDPGDVVDDTVTVAGTDDDGAAVSGQASESVAITGVASSLSVTKVADVGSVPEPGGPVTFTVTVTNTSTVDAVTIDSVTDSVDGGPAAAAGGTCPGLVGDVLDPGDTTSCAFTLLVLGEAGDTVGDTVTVAGTDDDGGELSAQASETVDVTDVGSTLSVTKVANVGSVPEPGGPVTYTVGIINSSTVDAVTIDSVTDSVEGGAPFAAGGDCPGLVGDVLAAGASTSCSFTLPVTGDPGDVVDDLVTVAGTDDDGAAVSAQASESVDVTDVPSSITVTKVANVDTLPEPGGPVTYAVTITNTSAVDPVTIDSVTDSVDGGAAFSPDGCDEVVGTVLAPKASIGCWFTLPVTGAPGTTVADTVTVDGTDDDGGPVSAQGSESVTITDVLPSLTVTKTASPSSVAETGPGETRTITYTVGIQNDSAEPLAVVAIVDAVDGGPAAPVAGTCADLISATLAAQAGTTCQFTMEVAGDAGDTTTDVVTVTAIDDEDNQVSASDDATVTFTDQTATLLVDKTADVSSVPEPGGPVTYTVTVTNTSTVDAVIIDSITDSVDGGAPFAAGGDCPALLGTTLAPGASDDCSFILDVTGDAGQSVLDTVTVTGTDDDGAALSGTGDESVAITDVASALAVTKTANVASVDEPGGPVTYTVGITNTSTVDDITLDSITDSVDGGAPFAAGGDCPDLVGDSLAPGASTSCSFTLDVTGQPGDVVADTVTVAGTDGDGAAVSGQASETVDIGDVATTLLVTKTPDVSSVPEPGAPVTFTVGITNQSTVDTVTLSSITDSVEGGEPFAAGGTCPALVGSELAPGASTSCAFTLAVAGNAGDVVADTVTVVGDDGDPEPVPGAPTETAKRGGPGGEEDPTPEPEPEPEAPETGPDRTVTGQGSAAVAITGLAPTGTVDKVATPNVVSEFGGPVSYGITVTNTSPQESVTLTSLTDAVAGSNLDATAVAGPITATTCATGGVIAPGGTYTCAFTYAIPAGTPGDTVVDTVTAVLVDDDGETVSPSDTETVTLTNVAPTITVDKDNGDAVLPAPGGDVDFTVTVGNPSAEAVTITSITDSVDGGAPTSVTGCSPGSVIVPGGSFSCTFRLAVTSDEAATIVDEVVVQAVDDDATIAQASDTAVTRITASADVSIDKRLAGPELEPGKDGAYELVVANAGPSKAVGVQVVDALPEGLTATAATGDGWTCTVAPRTVTCTRAELAAGESSTITISVSVSADAAGRSITNVADVTSTTDDPDLDNNHDELTTEVGEVAPNEENPPSGPIEPPAVGPADQGTGGGALPRTGSDSGPLVRDGLLLVGLGAVLLALRRFLTRRSPA